MADLDTEVLVLEPFSKHRREKSEKSIIAMNKFMLYKSFEMMETAITKSKIIQNETEQNNHYNSKSPFAKKYDLLNPIFRGHSCSYAETNEVAKTIPTAKYVYVNHVFEQALDEFCESQEFKDLETTLIEKDENNEDNVFNLNANAYPLCLIHFLHNAVLNAIQNSKIENAKWHKYLMTLYKDCLYTTYCVEDIMLGGNIVGLHSCTSVRYKESKNFYNDMKDFFADSVCSHDRWVGSPCKKLLLFDFSLYTISILVDIEELVNSKIDPFNARNIYLETLINCLKINNNQLLSMSQKLTLANLSDCSFTSINIKSDVEKIVCFTEIKEDSLKQCLTIASSFSLVFAHYKNLLQKNLEQNQNKNNSEKVAITGSNPSASLVKDKLADENNKTVVNVQEFKVGKSMKFRLITGNDMNSSKREAELCKEFDTCASLMQIIANDKQYDKLSRFCGFEELKYGKCIVDILDSEIFNDSRHNQSKPKDKNKSRKKKRSKKPKPKCKEKEPVKTEQGIKLSTEMASNEQSTESEENSTLVRCENTILLSGEKNKGRNAEVVLSNSAKNAKKSKTSEFASAQNHVYQGRRKTPIIVDNDAQPMTQECYTLLDKKDANKRGYGQTPSLPKTDNIAAKSVGLSTETVQTITYPAFNASDTVTDQEDVLGLKDHNQNENKQNQNTVQRHSEPNEYPKQDITEKATAQTERTFSNKTSKEKDPSKLILQHRRKSRGPNNSALRQDLYTIQRANIYTRRNGFFGQTKRKRWNKRSKALNRFPRKEKAAKDSLNEQTVAVSDDMFDEEICYASHFDEKLHPPSNASDLFSTRSKDEDILATQSNTTGAQRIKKLYMLHEQALYYQAKDKFEADHEDYESEIFTVREVDENTLEDLLAALDLARRLYKEEMETENKTDRNKESDES